MIEVDVAVIGAGPAGLMAAQALAKASVSVHVFDAMPSVGRKFLLAGIGGLNLTHAEPFEQFVQRYSQAQPFLVPLLKRFGSEQLREWSHQLGIETFVGSSQRVFPKDMKAAPLLRSWLTQLKASGVQFHARHRWQRWEHGPQRILTFETIRNGQRVESRVRAKAVVLALGGASWAKLGSDGAWVPWLQEQKIDIAPLKPSNCGFEVAGGWSAHLKSKFAGAPLKNIRLTVNHPSRLPEPIFSQIGECVITEYGLEGSLIYAASQAIRDFALDTNAANSPLSAKVEIDLLPNHSELAIGQAMARSNGKSLSSLLESRFRMDAAKRALFMEARKQASIAINVSDSAALLKALPVHFSCARPIDEAISTAGGVQFNQLDEHLMSLQYPGLFFAGEMLDWEAPTGGYLLTACFATGLAAGQGAAQYIAALPT